LVDWHRDSFHSMGLWLVPQDTWVCSYLYCMLTLFPMGICPGVV
jgi:hypothetical protein